MVNPIIAALGRYTHIPISAVIVSLRHPGGEIEIQIIRYGGSSGEESVTDAPCADKTAADNRWRMGLGPEPTREVYVASPGVGMHVWEHLPDIFFVIDGEYYRHEVAPMVRAAARINNALDVMEVRDGDAARWHFRPCNPRHWEILKYANGKTFRVPRKIFGKEKIK